MALVIGLDLGGTKIAAAIFDTETEQILARNSAATDAHLGPNAVLARIAELCQATCAAAGLAPSDCLGVGLGVPGTLDHGAGLTLALHNLPGDWHRRPVASQLRDHLQRPVSLLVDAHAFTLAEAVIGAGRGSQTVAGFTLGTGIGGGIVIDGRLHLGAGGLAAFFGHQIIDVNGLPDASGTPGGLESFASGPAITSLAIKFVQQGFTTQIRELAQHDIARITPELVMRAAQSGDRVALHVLDYAGKHIAAGIANVLTIVAPDCVVVGGGVAKLGEQLFAPIRRHLSIYSRILPPEHYRLVPAALGDDAGVIGAALWAAAQPAPSTDHAIGGHDRDTS